MNETYVKRSNLQIPRPIWIGKDSVWILILKYKSYQLDSNKEEKSKFMAIIDKIVKFYQHKLVFYCSRAWKNESY